MNSNDCALLRFKVKQRVKQMAIIKITLVDSSEKMRAQDLGKYSVVTASNLKDVSGQRSNKLKQYHRYGVKRQGVGQ